MFQRRKGNKMGYLKIVNWILLSILLILLIPSIKATLTCEGEGQVFFKPEFIERDTLSIPCTLQSLNPINASCLVSVYFEDELISVYPEIDDLDWFGRTSYIEIASSNKDESFVAYIPNKDLLHFTNFTWEVWCKELDGTFHLATGSIVTEFSFAEPIVDITVTFLKRDVGIVIGMFFIIIIIVGLAIILYKVVANK